MNNIDELKKTDAQVVICSHFSIFANNEQRLLIAIINVRGCDLLSF